MNTKTTFQPRTVGLLVTALLAAVLSSCGNSLCNGMLVGKWYEPEKIGAKWVDSEDFVFAIKGFNGEDTVVERFEVTQEVWYMFSVGDSVFFRDCR